MKKVGILTLTADNFGACLQAYALSHVVRENGYEVSVIHHYSPAEENKNIIEKLRYYLKAICTSGLPWLIQRLRYPQAVNCKKIGFDSFRNEFLFIDKERYARDESIVTINDKYDAFICGSDMIWSEEFINYSYIFFLLFAPSEKRIAYAPSLGGGNVSEQTKSTIAENCKDFPYLSCREESGAKLLSKLTHKEVPTVLDPTLLLTEKEWVDTFNLRGAGKKSKRLLIYTFTGDTEGRDRVRDRLCELFSADYSYIPMSISEYLHVQNRISNSYSPIDFLSDYYNADLVLTDTFHGLVFSLIFHKPFLVLERGDVTSKWAKYSERILNLLKLLHLEDHYRKSIDDFSVDDVLVSYNEVDKILSYYREESLNYLIRSLEGAMGE